MDGDDGEEDGDLDEIVMEEDVIGLGGSQTNLYKVHGVCIVKMLERLGLLAYC